MRRPQRALTAAALSALVTTGCFHPITQPPLTSPATDVTASQRSERLALGHLDRVAETPEAELMRLVRLTELEVDLGNYDQAAEAGRRLARLASVDIALARAEADATAQRLAEERARAARTALSKLGEAIGDATPIVDALALGSEPPSRRELRLLRWAIRHYEVSWRTELPGALLERLDDTSLAVLEGRGLLDEDELLPLDRLAALGASALPALSSRFARARDQSDASELRALAERIAALDALDLDAQVVRHLDRDLAAIDRPNREDLLFHAIPPMSFVATSDGAVRAMAASEGRLTDLAALQLAYVDHPDREGVALALARACLAYRLFGDASSLAGRVAASTSRAATRAVAEQIVAYAHAQAGDAEAYLAWADGAQASRSPSVLALEVAWAPEGPPEGEDGGAELPSSVSGGLTAAASIAPVVPEALSRRGLDAVRAQLTRRSRGLGIEPANAPAALCNPHLRPDDRRAALDILRRDSPADARLLAPLLSGPFDARACTRLQEGLSLHYDEEMPEDASGLAERIGLLGERPAIDAWFLANVEWTGASPPPQLVSWLDGLAGTGVGLTDRFIQLRIALDYARGDADAARRRLEADGALLPTDVAGALAWLLDAREGGAAPDPGLATSPGLLTDPVLVAAMRAPRGASDPCEPAMQESGPLDVLRNAWKADSCGDHAGAAGHYQRLSERADGPFAGQLAALAGVSAWRAGDAAALARARARAAAIAPTSRWTGLLDWLEADSRGDTGARRRAAAVLLRRAPDEHALVLYQRSLSGGGGGAVDAQIALAEAAVSFTLADDLKEARTAGLLPDLDTVARVVAAHQERDVRPLGPAYAVLPTAGRATVALVRAHVREADTVEAAVARAREALPYLDASPPYDRRRQQRVWLYFLAGQGEKALAVADEPRAPMEPLASSRAFGATSFAREAARQRATLGDELAVRLYWYDDRSDAVTAETLIARSNAHPELLPMACSEASGVDHADTVDLCVRSWREAPSAVAAVPIAYRIALDPERAGELGLDADAFFAEAERRFGEGLNEDFYHNESIYLASRGRAVEAARASLRAGSKGGAMGHGGPNSFEQVPIRGSTARARLGVSWPSPANLVQAGGYCLLDGEVEAGLLYLDGALRFERERIPEGVLSELFRERDMLLWAQRDLEGDLVDRAAVAAWARLRHGGFSDPRALRAFRDAHPGSRLAGIAVMATSFDQQRFRDVIRQGRELARDGRTPGTWALLMAPSLRAVGEDAEADALMATARAESPRDPRLAATPSAGPAPEPEMAEVPAWLASAGGLAARLGLVSETAPSDGGQSRVEDERLAAELVVPSDFTRRASTLSFVGRGTQLAVLSEPRDSHCAEESCFQNTVEPMLREGFRVLWVEPIALPAGRTFRGVVQRGARFAVVDVTPTGDHQLVVILAGDLPVLEAGLPALAMAEETLRPLDAVVGIHQATALRAVLRPHLPPDGHRSRLRALEGGEGAACPLEGALAALPAPEARGAVLADLYLVSPSVAHRGVLLRCAAKVGARVGWLAALTALEVEPSLHAFASSAARRDPDRAEEAARAIVFAEPTLPRAATEVTENDLPPFGALDLLSVLPETQARALVQAMLGSGVARLRAAALVANGVVERELVAGAELVRLVREGAPADALAALTSFPGRGSLPPEHTAAIRARVDALAAPTGRAELALCTALSTRLAEAGTAEDHARLLSLAGRIDASRGPDAEKAAEAVRKAADVLGHRTNVAPSSADVVVRLARQLETLLREVPRTERPSAAIARRLATESLADILTGEGWTYVRIPQPNLFVATVEETYARLGGESRTDAALVRRMLAAMAQSSGSELLSEGGGIDMTQPIECAVHEAYGGWVCAATVDDADAVRRQLESRAHGSNMGLALALTGGQVGLGTTMAAGLTPMLIDSVLGSDEVRSGLDASTSGALVMAERARMTVDVGGLALERYATLSVREGELPAIDTEHYLFTGRRIVAFALESVARRVLSAPPRGEVALSRNPRFRRLTRQWSQRGALQMASLGEVPSLSTLFAGNASLQLIADGSSALTVLRVAESTPSQSNVDALAALLPPGAVSQFAFAFTSTEELTRLLEDSSPLPAGEGVRPPRVALGPSDGFALGWYPDANDGVWSRWLLALQPNEGTRESFRDEGLPFPQDAASEAAVASRVAENGLVFARHGDVLLFSPVAELISEARARAAQARPDVSSGDRVGEGSLDGRRAGAVLQAMAQRRGGSSLQAGLLMAFGAVAAVGQDFRFEARREGDGRHVVVTSRITPSLSETRDPDALVDQLLRNDRNAIGLPRSVSSAEARRPLRLRIETSDPLRVADRVFGRDGRVTAAVGADGRLEVLVRPGWLAEELASPGPLGSEERDAALSNGRMLLERSERVRTILAEHVLPDAPVDENAGRIVAFVHRALRYELTAERLDPETILTRGRGDCTEYAQLAVAMLRAAGIPAEVRGGFAMHGREMVGHAWIAYHDGARWREADPTAGTMAVDASYLPVSIVALVGLLAIDDLRIVEVATE